MTYALSSALQAALYQTLSGDPGLSTLIGAHIYDDPAPIQGDGAPGTYVLIGAETAKDAGSATSAGAVHDFSVEVHSDGAGFKQAKEVAAAVCDVLLDAELTLSRGRVVYLRFLRAKSTTAPPPYGRRITLNFRAFVEDENAGGT